jgi:hypothetical protein
VTIRRLRLATASGWLAATLLALGAAAASAHGIHRPSSHGPKLVVTPRKVRPARGIAPGDTIQRTVELTLRGRGRLTAVYFRASGPPSTALAADPRQGLQITIDRCAKRWRKRGASFACVGKRWVVLASRPLRGRSRLAPLGLRGRNKTAHLRLLLRFPADAGNALQAASANVVYSFIGIAGR